MAKAGTNGVNKSEAIREILNGDPKVATKDVITTLASRGIRVKPHLIYLIKSKMRATRSKAKRQQAATTGNQLGISNPVQLILEVRQLSAKAGGIKHLKKLVDVLAE